jgi:uncharacterized protein YndB with AHSA1/START domain
MTTDRIEKQILLRVPRSRAWRAIATAREFGAWFGVSIEAEFIPGATVTGRIVEPPGYEQYPWTITVEHVEPESLFSFRWHPYAIDPDKDYSDEPTTLIEFRLQEVPEGTQLTVIESGFDTIPLARRAEAWRMNDEGWAIQVENLARYVGR